MPVYRQPYPPRSPSAGGRYRMARPTTYDALMGAPSPDNITQISDADYATAGAAGPPPAWGAGALPRGKPPKPAVQPAPGGAGAVDPRIHAMDSMSDYWRNLSKKFKPAAGGTTPQQSGAAAMLQGQRPPSATPQLGATPQFAPQRTVSPETDASANATMRPPLNPVAAQYLAGTPMAGATTASQVPRLRAQDEAARNRIASLPTAGARGDAMAPGLGLPTIAERIATGQRQPGYSDTLEGRRLGAVPARFQTPARQPTPNLDTAGILAGRAVDPKVQAYLARHGAQTTDSRLKNRIGMASQDLAGAGVPTSAQQQTAAGRLAIGDMLRENMTPKGIETLLTMDRAYEGATGAPYLSEGQYEARQQQKGMRANKSYLDQVRQGELAKRATRSEYRKTGERVTPEMIGNRERLQQALAGNLQPADYIPTAVLAESAGRRGVIPSLLAGAQIHAGQQKEEADRTILREDMASKLSASAMGALAGTTDPAQRKTLMNIIAGGSQKPGGAPGGPMPQGPYTAPWNQGAAAGLMGTPQTVTPPVPGTETYPYTTSSGQTVHIPYKASADFAAALTKFPKPELAAASLIESYPQDVLDALVESHRIAETPHGDFYPAGIPRLKGKIADEWRSLTGRNKANVTGR